MRGLASAAAVSLLLLGSGRASDPDDEEALIEWVRSEYLAQGGGEWPPVSVASFDGMRGLRADRPAARGDALLVAPTSLSLTVDDCADAKRIAQSVGVDPDDSTLLIMQVAVESRRMSSRWAPWLQSLPAELPDIPFYWPDAAWDLLRQRFPSYPNLNERMIDRHRNPAHRALRSALQRELGVGSDDVWHWATVIESSRAFGSPPKFYPLVDMANHRSGSPVPGEKYYGGPGTKSGPRVVAITATQPVAAGEQIFIRYGDHSDPSRNCYIDQLLAYGFLHDGGDARTSRGAYDCAELRIALPRAGPAAKMISAMVQQDSRKSAEVKDGMLKVLLSKGAPIPPILPVLYVVLYGDKADMDIVQKGVNSADGDPLQRLGGGKAMRRMRQDIAVMLEARSPSQEMTELFTALTEIAGMPPGGAEHLRNMQLGELRVLRAALKRIDAAAPPPDDQETDL